MHLLNIDYRGKALTISSIERDSKIYKLYLR